MRSGVKSTSPCNGIRLWLALSLAALVWSVPCEAEDQTGFWHPLKAAFHVHSQLSTGSDSLDALAAQAKDAGIEAILLTDNYLLRYEYGLYPFRGLIRRTVEMPSVVALGIDRYLAQVSAATQRHPDVTFIPGVEVVPHYYWTGSLFRKDLTMHDAQKNILVLGLSSERDYVQLPAAGNHGAYEYGWRTVIGLSPVLLIPPAVWLINHRADRKVRVGWTFMTVRSRRVGQGATLLIVASVLLANNYPFATPHYDLYRDSDGLHPHQDLIDYVHERGGLAVWSMPEGRDFHTFDYGRLGVVTVKTDPYPDVLQQTTGHTGFGALYEDTISLTNPGGIWDVVLVEYLQGRRAAPPWGFGEVAYHGAAHAGKQLYLVEMILWVRNRTSAAILDAMAKGRLYSLRRTKEYGLVLDDFSVAAEENGLTAISGETLHATTPGSVAIRLAVSATDAEPHPTSVQVIRSGRTMAMLNETTPFRAVLRDTVPAAKAGAYYRLMIGSGDHQIVTNPIFIKTATLPP